MDRQQQTLFKNALAELIFVASTGFAGFVTMRTRATGMSTIRPRNLLYLGIRFGLTVSRIWFIRNPLVCEVIIIARDITWLLSAFQFIMKLVDHSALNHFTTFCVYRMRDICIQPSTSSIVVSNRIAFEPGSTLITESGAQVILASAFLTMRGQLSAGHGNERPIVAFDNLEVTDNETVVECDAAESP